MVMRYGLLVGAVAGAFALAAPVQAHCGKCHDKCPDKCVTKTVVDTCNPCAPKCETAKGDLHCMSSKLNCSNGGWQLDTKYSVTVQNAAYEDFDVVLTPTSNDRDLSEYRVTVPAVKNGLFQQSSASIALPEGVVDDPRSIRVRGELVERTSSRVVDNEKAKPCVGLCCKRVKTCNPCETTVAVRTPCDPCRSTTATIYRRPGIFETGYVRPVETRTVAYHETRPCGCR
jgi:hypothetical protein